MNGWKEEAKNQDTTHKNRIAKKADTQQKSKAIVMRRPCFCALASTYDQPYIYEIIIANVVSVY